MYERRGQASIVAVLFLVIILSVIVFGFSYIAIPESRITRLDFQAKRSYAASEAGIEDVAYRIIHGKNYSTTEILTVDGIPTTVSTFTMGNQKEVSSSANASGAVRKIRVLLEPKVQANFNYGLQVGEGGLQMDNGSTVIGNVFSNGNISGPGVGQGTITGTAQVAGTHSIQNITISQDAYAQSFNACLVGNTAYYVTTFTNCTAGSTQVLAQPLGPQDFPISQAQIDQWKSEAQAGGTLNGYSVGNSASATLGPKKINGNITLGNNATLTLTGTVWVTGTITFGNTDIIKLDTSYGSASGVVIVDGAVNLGNSATLQGSGQLESYLTIISLATGLDAIDIGNSALGAILYAPNGSIDVGNNLALREATGYGLHVGNNTSITYESGLANVNFSSGPTGAFKVAQWKEIE